MMSEGAAGRKKKGKGQRTGRRDFSRSLVGGARKPPAVVGRFTEVSNEETYSSRNNFVNL